MNSDSTYDGDMTDDLRNRDEIFREKFKEVQDQRLAQSRPLLDAELTAKLEQASAEITARDSEILVRDSIIREMSQKYRELDERHAELLANPPIPPARTQVGQHARVALGKLPSPVQTPIRGAVRRIRSLGGQNS